MGRPSKRSGAVDAALQQSEEKYRTLYEAANDAIFALLVVDDILRFVECNSRTLEMFGCRRDDIIGKSPADFSPPVQPDGLSSMRKAVELCNAAMAGKDQCFEWRHCRLDRTQFDAEVRLNCINIAEHRYLQAIVRDITERKKAEQALSESERRYRTLFEGAPDAIFLADPESGLILDANPAASSLLNMSHEKILGLHYAMLHPLRLQAEAEAIFTDHSHGGGRPARTTVIRSDGMEVPVEILADVVALEGRPVLQGVFRDLTERERNEQALTASEERFRNLAENVPGLTYICLNDKKHSVIYLNDKIEDITGYSKVEFLEGKINLIDICDPEYMPDILPEKDRATADKRPYRVVYRIRRKDGGIRWIEDFGVCLFRGDQPSLLQGFAHDITERKRVEMKIQQYQESLRSLASELSLAEERQRRRIASDLHDNTSQELALTLMRLQDIRERTGDNGGESLAEVCDMLRKTVESVRDMTFDICSPTLYQFGLEAAIAELLEDKFGVHEKICYSLNDDNMPKPLSEDIKVAMFQSVRELINNVIKHANAANVTVDMIKCEDKIRITVKDDGAGFNARRLRSPEKSKGGFGLFSIAERLEYIGGHFDFQSRLGRGSCFTLEAPLDAIEE
ncbi:MAG: PAS domain S-box protein [Sedimentisphaerales bacterium]|nr:PAS domain S-box protein [Sedimentisphaerales bacterium]